MAQTSLECKTTGSKSLSTNGDTNRKEWNEILRGKGPRGGQRGCYPYKRETMERRRSKLMDCSLAGSQRTSSESTIGEAGK